MSIAAVNLLNKEMFAVESLPPKASVQAKLLGKQTPGHIPALDGLRGIAVLLVLFCHATQRPWGEAAKPAFHSHLDQAVLFLAHISWVGVDLFFVLSGFLITGILFDAKGKDRFFTNFYARRTVRIFPLYYACLVLYLLVFPLLGAEFNRGMGTLTSHQAWYWTYLSNYAQSVQEQRGNGSEHLIHVSWTLSIEEQFYLCWPLVVFLFSRKSLLKICGLMFFGSMLLRTAFTLDGKIYWALGFTPCRVDGLAIGAAIALVARGPLGLHSLLKPAKWMLPASAVCIGALIVLMLKLGYHQGVGQSPGYAIAATGLFALMFGSVLVIAAAAKPGSLTQRFFELPIFRVYGKYSYAVYLFHIPIMVLIAEHGIFNPVGKEVHGTLIPALIVFYALTWGASLLAALVSWNVMEKHCLKLKRFFPMESHERQIAAR